MITIHSSLSDLKSSNHHSKTLSKKTLKKKTQSRLFSQLYCSAMLQIVPGDFDFASPSLCSFHDRSMEFPWNLKETLATCNDRCEVLAFMIQKMTLNGVSGGFITAAPPIVSRAFQELSNGMVTLNNVRKIKEIPFPFAFAQM